MKIVGFIPSVTERNPSLLKCFSDLYKSVTWVATQGALTCWHESGFVIEQVNNHKPNLIIAFGRILTDVTRAGSGVKVVSAPSIYLPLEEFEAQLEGIVVRVRTIIAEWKPDDEFSICGRHFTGQKEFI